MKAAVSGCNPYPPEGLYLKYEAAARLSILITAFMIQSKIWVAAGHQVFQAAFRCRFSFVSSVREACDEVSLPREWLIPSLTRCHRRVLTGNNVAPNQVNRYAPTETTTTQKRTYRKTPHTVSIPDHLLSSCNPDYLPIR